MADLIKKGGDSSVQQSLTASAATGQPVAHPHMTRAPLLKEVPKQGFVLATVAGTHYVYTNINGVLLKAAFTAA